LSCESPSQEHEQSKRAVAELTLSAAGTILSRNERVGSGGTPADGVSTAMKAKLLLVIVLYMAALLWAYVAIAVPEFGYEGFALKSPRAVQMVLLILMVLLPVSFLPSSSPRPSALIVWWLYLTVYIPAIMVPALSLSMPLEKSLQLQLTLLLCLGLLSWASSGRRLLRVRQIVVSPTLFWPAFLAVWVICLGIMIGSAKFSSIMSNIASLFEGADEYTIRSKFNDLARGIPLLGYLIGQVALAFNPFLIAFGLRYRRTTCLIAGIAGQIIAFSLAGYKASLASIVFLCLIAVFIRRWRRSLGLAFASGLMIAVLASTVIDRATNSVFFTSVITRRTILTPGLLTGFYFEHYSQIGPVGMGYHFALLRDERVLTPPNEIGYAYFDDVNVNANANVWAEGYAELGFLGSFLYTIILGFMIWIYDSIAAGRDPTMAILLAAMPAAGFANTLPSTVLITHGGLAAALLLYFLPSPSPSESSEAGGRVVSKKAVVSWHK